MMSSGIHTRMTHLVESLVQGGVIKSQKVKAAMLKVDRGDYCSSKGCYDDSPQGINYGATISAPHMHAYCLEWLKDSLVPGAKVLDVGSGSGYLVAAFYEMMESSGKVVGIDHIQPLVDSSINNLSKHYSEAMKEGSITIICGDGRKGYEPLAPYDVIHVGAAAEIVPQELFDQLAVGGRLIIPVGPDGYQQIVRFTKEKSGQLSQKVLLGVRYVPLTSKEDQCPHIYNKKSPFY